jgi:pilus assembly protein Flp/PilA
VEYYSPGHIEMFDENRGHFSCSLQKKFIQACRSPAVNQTWGQPGEQKISDASYAEILLMSKMRENIMDRMAQYVKQFLSEEDGVTAIEYGLIAALIAVMIIGGAQLVGEGLLTTFTNIATRLTGA